MTFLRVVHNPFFYFFIKTESRNFSKWRANHEYKQKGLKRKNELKSGENIYRRSKGGQNNKNSKRGTLSLIGSLCAATFKAEKKKNMPRSRGVTSLQK